jgi:ribonuclease PH
LRRAAGRRRHRTAAITGSWVALHFAFEWLIKEGKLASNPITGQVAAVSCGLWQGTAVLDLDYPETRRPMPTPTSC